MRANPMAQILAERTGVELDRIGRVMVEADLCLPNHPQIHVIGDLAHFVQDGAPLPGVAPVAMQQGRYVASAIEERLKGANPPPFRYLLVQRRLPLILIV